MSGLSPVPRIPNRPSTRNGSEAATEASDRDRQPDPRASRSVSTRPTR